MANLTTGQDDGGVTEPIDPELPDPPTHGQVHAGDGDPATRQKLTAHLGEHERHLDQTSRFGGHGQRHGAQANADVDAASSTSTDQNYDGNT